MLISRYFEKFLDDQVTEEAIVNYYNTRASEYEKKKAHVAHVLIHFSPEELNQMLGAEGTFMFDGNGEAYQER